jgi:tetratricopeptide (TPR) repeat protein
MSFFTSRRSAILAVLFSAVVLFATVSFAQQYPSPAPAAPPQGAQGTQATPPAPRKLNPKEEVDYKALLALPNGDAATADKKIQLGQQFLQKYPDTRYQESVYNQIVSAYYAKQDWFDFYANADRVLGIDPDDVDVLTVYGWVIPHLYNKDEPDADKKLDKGETYEKHAIDVIASLPKPDSLTEDQFAQAKQQQLEEAHSGLGLIYFRRQDFANSVKELQLATQGNTSPDQTDLFALGVGLQQLNRNGEAADAFTKCSQASGALQDRCKQMADQAKSAK